MILDRRFPSRRELLATGAATGLFLSASPSCAAWRDLLDQPVTLGFIADLHHDLMHDGMDRIDSFANAMNELKPDAVVQLGDFAYPKAENSKVIDRFNGITKRPIHVIGNHDTDAKHTVEQCKKVWGMPSNYFSMTIHGLTIMVLDGNEQGSPTYKSGYPSYISPKQLDWLDRQLTERRGPAIILSHQPLAGPYSVDNALDVQKRLAKHADKILLAFCGHSHIDTVRHISGVSYVHINSASYYWVGEKAKHFSYPKAIHDARPSLASTCPYRDALYAMVTVDAKTLAVTIKGRSSEWVGATPTAAGAKFVDGVRDGEEVTPRIQDRVILRNQS